MDEKTYTLDEARRVMRIQECRDHGHSWDVVENWTAGPMRLTCGTCGWSGTVTMGDRPKP